LLLLLLLPFLDPSWIRIKEINNHYRFSPNQSFLLCLMMGGKNYFFANFWIFLQSILNHSRFWWFHSSLQMVTYIIFIFTKLVYLLHYNFLSLRFLTEKPTKSCINRHVIRLLFETFIILNLLCWYFRNCYHKICR
jgi:hypothetical protein